MDDGFAVRSASEARDVAVDGAPSPGGQVAEERCPAPILVEIGAGELVDKITILRIKAERIADPAKRANVSRELAVLERAQQRHLSRSAAGDALQAALRDVNLVLWTIEDEIRGCEERGDFGPRFIELARAVYKTNDRRAALKKDINLLAGAAMIEEKSYAGAR